MSLLQCHALSVRIADRTLIDQLSLDIQAGQCWVALGPNGSGKSSLLKGLVGLHRLPGQLSCAGVPISRLAPRERARQLGLLLQHSHTGFHSSALEMVLSGTYPHRRAWGYEGPKEIAQATAALQRMEIQHLAKRPLEALSGGELRRAEIARLMVQSPKLAMLDEPLNHLDLAQQIAVLRALREHFCTPKHGLLMVLHDINLACRFATHLLLLHGDGRWQAGPVEQLGNAKHLGNLFGLSLHSLNTPNGPVLQIQNPG